MAEKQLRVVFSFTESELKKFEKYLVDSGVAADKLQDQLKDVGKESDKAFSQASNGINQLVTGVKAFLALEVVNMLKNAAAEASKFAAEAEGVRSAFRNMGGGVEDLKKLREAVNGTVADINLIQKAVNAKKLGIGFEDLTKILEQTNKVAGATGQNFEQLSDTIVTAIGKGQVERLKALGINIKSTGDKVKDTQNVVEALTRQTKQLGDVSNETAENYAKIAAAQTNLKEAFGNLVNSKPFQEVQAFLAGRVQRFADVLNEGQDPLSERLAQVRAQVQSQAALNKQFADKGLTRDQTFYQAQLKELAELEKQMAARTARELREQRKKNFEQSKIDLQNQLDAQAEIDAKFQESEDEKKKQKYQKFLDDKYQMNREAEQREADAQVDFLNKQLEAGLQAEQDLIQSILDPSSSLNAAKVDPTQEDLARFLPEEEEVDKIFSPAEKAAENVKLDFNDALNATTQIAGLFMAMGSEESGPAKFIKQLIAIAAPLLNTLTGGVGGTLLSGFASFFNEGGMVGQPVGPNRDTVLAGLTLGEYVVKRDSTKRSALLLDAINAGEIDDKILLKLNQSPVVVNVDQAKVVEAIQNMPQVEFYKNGSILYEHRMNGANKRAERIRRISL